MNLSSFCPKKAFKKEKEPANVEESIDVKEPIDKDETNAENAEYGKYVRRSNWWFLLPIILEIVGGIIAYFVLKSDDPQKAKDALYLGIALTAVNLVSFGIMALFFGSVIY